ncbi:hypothetical protein [Actinoallomurus iriomotensis]|uniref:Uncharacterized protein n=1 Tax=Actinoallomurus iriomotensis TaxID=478107 RepID=A0A9W6S290_9ACTN|nr:hypothetical protein [Actinoallomurus iriomotensis]GLY85936.1 hypothetical protein Airi02_038650 [Actinoallomurus iriomotensis]
MAGLTMATHHLGLVMRIVGAVVLAGGYALMPRGVAAQDESRGERTGRAIVVTGVIMLVSGGIGTFLALLTGVVGALITLTDEYTHRYGTPVTVTPASTCQVRSRNGAVRGDPDGPSLCPPAPPGTRPSPSAGPPPSSARPRSADGSPGKWIVITVSALCLTPPGWVLAKTSA